MSQRSKMMIFWVLIITQGVYGGDIIHMTKLTDELLQAKDSNSALQTLIPVAFTNVTMEITIDVSLASVNSFDEIGGYLEISGYLLVKWISTVNKPSRFNVSVLFESSSLWKPSLFLVNAIKTTSEIGDSTSKLRCNLKSWECTWKPWVVLQGGCLPDVRFYPFDRQICSYKIAAWGHTASELTLKPSGSEWDLVYFQENPEWTIERTASVSYVRNNVSYAEFTIELKRLPIYYIINLIAPVTLLSLVNVFVFILPSQSGERVSFSVTCFLSFVVLLNLIMTFIPSSSANLAHLCYYTFIMMVFSCGMSLATVFTLWIHFKLETSKVPIILRGFVYIFKCHCFHDTPPRRRRVSPVIPTETMNSVWHVDEDENIINHTENQMIANGQQPGRYIYEVTWKDVASIMDIFFLLGFLTAQIFYSVGYLLPIILHE